ncbi:DUF6929 family protein [Flavobacterium croceum]|uniref:DUF6929 family protein n=1 Tax=Flavobacterium croceum TaxID=370975 RepID=UPI0024A89DD0|nr:hypothetical protein [Flavobacterium croceum]
MEKFIINSLCTIYGLGSASGIIYQNENLYLISDNSTYLFEYHTPSLTLEKISITKNASQNIVKNQKPDYEALTLYNNKLYLYGSGSTKNRTIRTQYNLANKKIKEKKLDKLYQKLKHKAKISDDAFNIEGVIMLENKILFFQRGNKGSHLNGIFVYNKTSKQVDYFPVFITKEQNIEATFTDAILVENTIYFLAAAENSSSTYLDGEILGTWFGSMDLDTFQINQILKISNNQKFEGITLYKNLPNQKEFLLCEDNDTEKLESTIYKLTLL